jgi:MFS family permease
MNVVTGAVQETWGSIRTIAANPGLRRLNLALAGSMIGDWAYATAIVVWAYQQGGATAVGVWGVVRLTAVALVTPFAAMLADRFPRVAVLVGSDLLRALIMVAAAVVIAGDGPPLLVYAVATLASLVAAPFRPAQLALLPQLVRSPEELTAANGVGSTLESLAFFVGPAIGGLLLTVTSVPVVIVVQVATLLWSAALVLSIRHLTKGSSGAPSKAPDHSTVGDSEDEQHAPSPVPPPAVAAGVDASDGPTGGTLTLDPPAEQPDEGFLRESMAGFRAIWANRDLRLITGLYAAQTLIAGASLVFEVTLAADLIGIGAEGVGYLDSVMGVGALAGGLLAISLARRGRLASDFGYGVMFWAVPLVLITIWPAAGAAFLAMFIIGVANPIADVNANTIMQRVVPDAVLGRVFGALDTALIAAMAVGSLLMPLLINQVGIRWSLTLIAAPVVLLVLLALPRLRRLDEQLREPPHLALVSGLSIFQPLQRTELEAIALQLEERRVPAGAVVLTEGEVGDRFYIIESGAVEVVQQGAVVNRLEPGDVFGEIALLRDVPRTASVRGVEDCVLQTLEREAFLAAVSNPEVRSRTDAIAAKRLPSY